MRHAVAFLWSLLNLAGGSIKQHIVIQYPPSIENHRVLLEQTFSNGIDPSYENRKLIRFSNQIPYLEQDEGMTIVPMSSVFRSRNDMFPRFHMFSQSHFTQFSQSIYQSAMDYADFCKMEDKLAHIVNNYLDDEKNNWLIFMDDPFLMGSIRGYGLKSSIVDRTSWVTLGKTEYSDMILTDIQKDPKHV